VRQGYRPVRDLIRVEATVLGGRPVIHNYGHGGGGVTVSWGCAREVATMVERLAPTLS
jgi:D-amino-acid oxidase